MKKILSISIVILLFVFIEQQAVSQITITQQDMPSAGVDLQLYTQSPLSTMFQGYATGGENLTWDFSLISSQVVDTAKYISSSSLSIQYVCIAVYNNPLDPDHNATVARLGEDISDPMGNIEVTNVFEFFKNNSQAYTMVGRSANVNGLPTCIRNNPVDTVYKFPLNYGNTYSSFSQFEIEIPSVGYYGQSLQRSSTVDAWGEITTPLGSFDALRVKSTLLFIDTIYYESSNFGIKIPHTETHYTWLTNDFQIPVFVIEEKGATFGGTIAYWVDTTQSTQISLIEHVNDFDVFPNPSFNGHFFVKTPHNHTLINGNIFITDMTGKRVKSVPYSVNKDLYQFHLLPKGTYIIGIEGLAQRKKIVVL
jgi:hypothetical protein